MLASRRLLIALLPLAVLVGCATTPTRTGMRVNIASVERIEGGTMELRFIARLRVQNPNDGPVEFTGATADLQLNGKTIGTGVSDGRGSVPRLGETFVLIPITVSALGDVRQAIGLYGAPDRRLDSVLKGRLVGSSFDELRFEWRGELAMPLPNGR